MTGIQTDGEVETDLSSLLGKFRAVRKQTEDLCAPLEPEDYIIQSSDDVSPPKWHLAHTTWFFENFILKKYCRSYSEYNPSFSYLYNSYYESVGSFFPKTSRGLVSRPGYEKIFEYRKYVENALLEFVDDFRRNDLEKISYLILLGMNHEQQHQELLLMDIKHNLYSNPGMYRYMPAADYSRGKSHQHGWKAFGGGVRETGFSGEGFSFDNETPSHKEYVHGFEISDTPVTCGEYLSFIEDGGYGKPEYWLSDGWNIVRSRKWEAPLYWVLHDEDRKVFTLSGLRDLDPEEPVSHLSYYEADAFARWADSRLPTEAEWEVAAQSESPSENDNFLESSLLHPSSVYSGNMKKMFGDVWEWTSSAYLPYPGFRPLAGSLGEYNGKFMSGQMVLRGGSCLTPISHIRSTYRNFFAPDKRWPVTGLRLARDRS